METILVTGANGFLGRSVINQLAQLNKYHIVGAVSGRHPVNISEGVQVEKFDLLRVEAGAELIEKVQPDILCHLAWGQENEEFRNSPSNIQWLEASTSLLRAFIAHRGKRFLFAGSSSEYENYDGKALEICQSHTMSLYGECKRAFSSVLKNYCSRTHTEYVIARYFTIYGENDPHKFAAIPQAIYKFLRNEPVICYAPNTIRDYIYIEDAARATVKMLVCSYCGAVNISSGKPHSMKDVFHLIANILNKETLLHLENEDICDLILVGNNTTLINQLGFQGFMSFEEGMKKTIAWWCANQQ